MALKTKQTKTFSGTRHLLNAFLTSITTVMLIGNPVRSIRKRITVVAVSFTKKSVWPANCTCVSPDMPVTKNAKKIRVGEETEGIPVKRNKSY